MDFSNWLDARLQKIPECDKLHLLIQVAGPIGISEGELRSQIDLPKKTVDELLAALMGSRQIVVMERDGNRIYFARS